MRLKSGEKSQPAALGQGYCFITMQDRLACPRERGSAWRRNVMEFRTESSREFVHTRVPNHCAQCGEPIFLPEWSEYLDRCRVRHLWECEACGYKFETLVSFPNA